MAKLSLSSIPFDKVGALSRVHRLLICAGVFLAMGAGFYYFIYMPRLTKLNELKEKFAGIEAQLASARAAAANLEDFQKEYEKAQIQFKLALQLLPDKKEIPGLLESVSRSGKDSGLDFLLFQPGKEVNKGFYAEIPVDIQVRGGYHHLAMFFARVANLSRIVNISRFTIETPRKSRAVMTEAAAVLDVSCVAVTYRFLESAEAPKAGAKPTKKKG